MIILEWGSNKITANEAIGGILDEAEIPATCRICTKLMLAGISWSFYL